MTTVQTLSMEDDKAPHLNVSPYTFRSNLKPLRNKHGACAGCNKAPPEGQTFSKKCSGCEAVLYCSKECQTADWRTHRYVALRFWRQAGESLTFFSTLCHGPAVTRDDRIVGSGASILLWSPTCKTWIP